MKDPIDILIAVLREENAALEALDLAATGSLLGRKQEAIATFQSLLRSGKPGRERAREIAELTAANRRLLELAMEAQKEVLAILARAARQSTASGNAQAYGAAHRHAPQPRGPRLRESAFALHANA